MPKRRYGTITLSYTDSGSGELVVMLHSSASFGGQWRPLCAELEGRYRMVAPDFPGYGQSDPWPETAPPTLAEEAGLVAALSADLDRRFHLVGHSYGGAVALSLALRHPGRLASLTLIEPVAFHLLDGAGGFDALCRAEIADLASDVAQAVEQGDGRRAMRRFVDYWNGPDSWSALSGRQQQAIAEAASRVVLDFQATRDDTVRLPDYRALELPILLLCGVRSPQPVRHISALLGQALPDARLELLPGAGHMAPVTHPQTVSEAVARHLDGRTARLRAA